MERMGVPSGMGSASRYRQRVNFLFRIFSMGKEGLKRRSKKHPQSHRHCMGSMGYDRWQFGQWYFSIDRSKDNKTHKARRLRFQILNPVQIHSKIIFFTTEPRCTQRDQVLFVPGAPGANKKPSVLPKQKSYPISERLAGSAIRFPKGRLYDPNSNAPWPDNFALNFSDWN